MYRIRVTGAVQGIGFRPFVAGLAEELHIAGDVRNAGGIVRIRAWAGESVIREFAQRLKSDAPYGAIILDVDIRRETAPEPQPESFRIITSTQEDFGSLPVFVPDLGICPECLREMKDPSDRRYRYPLISCVSCGPRWSILDSFPYDRDTISMKEFAMCGKCRREYTEAPASRRDKAFGRMKARRRHAQTISCHDCGPQMRFASYKAFSDSLPDKPESTDPSTAAMAAPAGELAGREAFLKAAELLKSGGILALLGVAGFQLLASPFNESTVERLRLMKGREEKPFAVMFASPEDIKKYCDVSKEEEELLLSPARPIVLLENHRHREQAKDRIAEPDKEHAKETGPEISDKVCKRSRYLGAFLPASGIQEMLCAVCGPLIATSANKSGNLIPIDPAGLKIQFGEPAGGKTPDAVYWHDRKVRRPLDDSVAAVAGGRTMLIRRSRGYVPLPVFLQTDKRTWENDAENADDTPELFAAGGDLKAAFAVRKGGRIILSQYFGDLENYSVMRGYLQGAAQMEEIFRVKPKAIICDMHPGYFSTQNARRIAAKEKLPLYEVQHHHAHIASVMAEHDLTSCIGIAFDGTGFGTDGQLWGGEFLLCREGTFTRCGSLSPVPMTGGDNVSSDALLAADCLRAALGMRTENPLTDAALKMKSAVILSSSMGRLFDAASAFLGLCSRNTYEGECAILLENAAAGALSKTQTDLAGRISEELPYFPGLVTEDGAVLRLSQESLIRGILAMTEEGIGADRAALAFHDMISFGAMKICLAIRRQTGENNTALSGGCFVNRILTLQCTALLEEQGFSVYRNEQVPCSDGGISLGQAYIGGFLCV